MAMCYNCTMLCLNHPDAQKKVQVGEIGNNQYLTDNSSPFTHGRTDFLWKEYLRDPLDWCWSEVNPQSSCFMNKGSLYSSGGCNSFWQQEKQRVTCNKLSLSLLSSPPLPLSSLALSSLSLLSSLEEEEEDHDDKCFSFKRKIRRNVKAIHNKVPKGKQELNFLPNTKAQHTMQQDSDRRHKIVALLKICAKQKDLKRGSRIHVDIIKMGLLKTNVFVGNTLISMYAKCGSLVKAQEVFDELPFQNVVSWSALISGYTQHGHGEQALRCFEQMRLKGLSPDAFTFACILKACGSTGAAEKGKDVHDQIVREGLLEKDIVLGTALVDMYARCGMLAKAQEVFDNLPVRNVVSWNALIGGYAQHENTEQAVKCFRRMQLEGLSPNSVTFLCILKGCDSLEAAKVIHTEIIRQGLLKKDIVVGTALVDMYAKCGLLVIAQEVFDMLPVRNVVTWSALMSGYAQHGKGSQALKCFEKMQLEGVSPDAVAFVCVLNVCGTIGAAEEGKKIHTKIVKDGFLEKDIVLGTALVDMYAKCGLLIKAQEVFDKLPVQNLVSWNTLMAGYAQHGHGKQAVMCFEQMRLKGLSPDSASFVSILKACSSIGDAEKGKEIHAQIHRKGLLKTEVVVGTSLVDMYAKCGLLPKAQEVFDSLPVRNVVSWSVLIAGYVQHGQCEKAVKCFEEMQQQGLTPDSVIFVNILKACGNIGATEKAKEVHSQIIREGLLQTDMIVGTALVHMYVKFGLLTKAQEVFDKLLVRDVALWNVLLAGYALLGKVEHIFNLFDMMIEEGIMPDMVTFTMVLNACNHSGLVDKGQMYFEIMTTCYGVTPDLEHHTCMVDLFARAGHLGKAVEVIKEMPCSADFTVWHTLLGACQKWRNLKVGRLAFDHAVQLDEKEAVAYVCMSNIYAYAGRQEDADEIEVLKAQTQE